MDSSSPTCRILVAEDDDITRKLLLILLRSKGYDVVAAATGAEVLACFDSTDPPPQFMVLDFEFPDMTAREIRAVQLQHALYASVPVVLMTAHPRGVELARELDAAAFLSKPFLPQNLLATIQRMCCSEDESGES